MRPCLPQDGASSPSGDRLPVLRLVGPRRFPRRHHRHRHPAPASQRYATGLAGPSSASPTSRSGARQPVLRVIRAHRFLVGAADIALPAPADQCEVLPAPPVPRRHHRHCHPAPHRPALRLARAHRFLVGVADIAIPAPASQYYALPAPAGSCRPRPVPCRPRRPLSGVTDTAIRRPPPSTTPCRPRPVPCRRRRSGCGACRTVRCGRRRPAGCACGPRGARRSSPR